MSFVRMMIDNRSIRYISKELSLSTATVFNWRHKVLSSFAEVFQQEFKGVVETDDVFIRFNQKGRRKHYRTVKKKAGVSDNQVAIMMVTDRYKNMDMKVAKLGRINVEDMNRVIDLGRLNENNIVCSDMHRTIESFFKTIGIKHIQIKSSVGEYVKDKIYNVNRLNGMVSEFRRWMKGSFISVATKYLQNYLMWFITNKTLEGQKGYEEILMYSMKDAMTYDRHKKIESRYQLFLDY
jgi:hypothetical protein